MNIVNYCKILYAIQLNIIITHFIIHIKKKAKRGFNFLNPFLTYCTQRSVKTDFPSIFSYLLLLLLIFFFNLKCVFYNFKKQKCLPFFYKSMFLTNDNLCTYVLDIFCYFILSYRYRSGTPDLKSWRLKIDYSTKID